MKRVELIISALLVPIDFLMIVAAGLVSYYLRFTSFADVRPVLYELPLEHYFNIVLTVGLLWLAVFALSGLYSIRGTKRIPDELAKIFFACSTGVMLLIILIFFQRELFSSRFIVLSGWVLSILFVGAARLLTRLIQHSLFKRGIGTHGLFLVGADHATDQINQYFLHKPALGYRITGRASSISPELFVDLERRVDLRTIDEIIVADSSILKSDILRLIEFAHDHHIAFKYAADRFETQAASLEVAAIVGIPIIEIRRTPLDGWGMIIKHVVDFIGAALGLLVFSPFGLIVALVIALDSPGPIFVGLERIGRSGNKFKLYKFRSMVKNAHDLKPQLIGQNERNDGPLFKLKNDPRVTRFGRFIRKTSIDEIPQLWNVLRGEMSLVGPRPHEPEEVAQYARPQRTLLTVKPGVTGLAQISGRSDLSFDEEVRLDTYYIEHWSFKLDLHILAKTPSVVLSTRSAA